MKLPRFPLVIVSRRRYCDAIDTATADAYNEGYQAALEIKAEIAKSRKAIAKRVIGKPSKARP